MKNIFKKIVVFILELEAKAILKRYKPKIVAITGSVGKTSTKDAVYAVLSKFYFVRKSDKSFNSEIGLSLTILGVQNGWNDPIIWINNILNGLWFIIWKHKYPEWLVLEVGAGKPGDIKRVAKWMKADVVIITRFGETPVHVEFFKSTDHLIEEKSSLIGSLKKDGVLILNADDEAVIALKSKTKSKLATFSFGNDATISGSNCQVIYFSEKSKMNGPAGISFKANFDGNSLPVIVEGALGVNHVYSALTALVVAYELNLNMIMSINALRDYDLPPGRMRALAGISGSVVIDDTYNASPIATISALKALGEAKNALRRIAVLGDMLELGKFTESAHRNIGRELINQCDILITVGPRSRFIYDEALSSGMDQGKIFHFKNSSDAGEFLKEMIQKGDTVLVKGSQGMRMERTVKDIMEHPEESLKLLARQEKEWLAKE